ncbi:MAG TPA: glycosyltransferase, partial [Chitinophagales bacterium]|nr:glycosyltransferase [Bacteroidota bacterium]HMU98641.1 glycosyltransferase [Chitinophagales bacterium]HMZ69212.1 glycosyltransferase [Chitinophagales bacterium]HNG09384.1 glycosyltransferase [Chitinophagales bacterium]HNM67535.1 glycosyltransferase [Chitinophagales bacterium]
NCGKGNALQAGILQAQHNWVLCNDADLSYRLEQIDDWYDSKLFDLNKNGIVYFGKRIINDKKSKFFIHRIIIGKIYFLLIKLILGINIQDTQCGFKLYPTTIAKKVFKDLHEKRFAFDLEIIYKLIQQNISIQTLPVQCIDIEGSKVNLLKDSWNMFCALFRIRNL